MRWDDSGATEKDEPVVYGKEVFEKLLEELQVIDFDVIEQEDGVYIVAENVEEFDDASTWCLEIGVDDDVLVEVHGCDWCAELFSEVMDLLTGEVEEYEQVVGFYESV